jgi:hypothetical protein
MYVVVPSDGCVSRWVDPTRAVIPPGPVPLVILGLRKAPSLRKYLRRLPHPSQTERPGPERPSRLHQLYSTLASTVIFVAFFFSQFLWEELEGSRCFIFRNFCSRSRDI